MVVEAIQQELEKENPISEFGVQQINSEELSHDMTWGECLKEAEGAGWEVVSVSVYLDRSGWLNLYAVLKRPIKGAGHSEEI